MEWILWIFIVDVLLGIPVWIYWMKVRWRGSAYVHHAMDGAIMIIGWPIIVPLWYVI